MGQASTADAEQITEMKAAVPSTSHLAAGQGTAPEHLLDLRRLPAHSQLESTLPAVASARRSAAVPVCPGTGLSSKKKTELRIQRSGS